MVFEFIAPSFRANRQSYVTTFASLQPDEEHGCPVVTLPDEATDLRNLLSMIYNRRFGDDTWRSEYSTYDQELDVATGVVFLANKYGMDRLYCETISWLQDIFPTKFQQFEPGSRFRHTVLARPKGGGPACLIRLTNVARSSQTPELTAMLPFLFYLGAQLDVVELLDGSPRTDGTMERLQPRDMTICVEGTVALIAANSSATRCFLAGEGNLGSACRSRGACYTSMSLVVGDGLKEDFFANSDPLRDVTQWLKQRNYNGRLCDSCVAHLLDKHKKAREKIWTNLPSILRLDIA
ncbi:uncharacterized protein C8Q71DRAFT_257412 [Rhodofomes roseus]|uniref:Uncharacterized protein n=1 Tax=Rhodofomes roseus TaxID=34475 RepID=A0ABQ8K6A5_9APHY|nr:uncharacterized protein C8Q71DRAFT_257412 [Rhodofomes roseus]KAH9832530.1 hypothetical protein C8Q71DRAFT_257412 [Rhodofomes roseus]